MALQEKKIMPPPWLAHREIERYSIGWRMGYGEDYIYRFGDWLDTLSPDEQTEYRTLFPEPVTWKGWWDDEDSSEVLEHGDFWVNAWQPEGSPKYTRQWLQQEFSMGRKRELCLGPSACRGRPADKKLSQPVVDGGFLVRCQYLSLYGAVYDGRQGGTVQRSGDSGANFEMQRPETDQGPGPQGAEV